MFEKFLNFIWPVSDDYFDHELSRDLEVIKTAAWKSKPEIFLEEARRLRDAETARKNSADTKSQIYLGVLLAIVPTAITIGNLGFFKNTLSSLNSTSTIALGLITFGAAYGVAAFVYALRTLNVTAYTRVDVDELVKHASSKQPIDEVTKEILTSVRHDRAPVNQKVGLVKLTQQHVARMAIMFICGLSILSVWPHLFDGLKFIWSTVCNQ